MRSLVKRFWLLCAVLVVVPAHAGVSISPAILGFSAGPGGNYRIPITIRNTSKEREENLKLYVESTRSDQDASMLEWVKVSKEKIQLKPSATEKVDLKIKIPGSASGDFRVTLYIDQDEEIVKQQVPVAEEEDPGQIQLGRRRTLDLPRKFSGQVVQTMRMGIPVRVRIQNAENANWKEPQLSFGRLNLVPVKKEKGDFAMVSVVMNPGFYDTEVKGTCRLLHAKTKKELKVAALDGGGENVLPAIEKLLRCHFKGMPPAGTYLTVMDLVQEVRGSNNPVKKQLRTRMVVDEKLLTKLQSRGDQEKKIAVSDKAPLMVEPSLIRQQPKGRPKSESVVVTNPTDRVLNVVARFQSFSDSRKRAPKVKVKPKKFKLRPAKEKKVSLQIKPAKGAAAYGKLILSTKGGEPVEVPMVIVPQKVKPNVSAMLDDAKVDLDREKEWVTISAQLAMTGRTHLEDVEVGLRIENSKGEPVKITQMDGVGDLLLPGEKRELTLGMSLKELKDEQYNGAIVLKGSNDFEQRTNLKFSVDRERPEILSQQ